MEKDWEDTHQKTKQLFYEDVFLYFPKLFTCESIISIIKK